MMFYVIFLLCSLYTFISPKLIQLNKLFGQTLTHQVNDQFDLQKTKVQLEGTLMNYQSVEYLIKVQVGLPEQDFDIIIDTGSSDTWIPQVGAQGFKKVDQQNFYDCNSSISCYNTQKRLSVSYGDGPIKGNIIWDQISLNQLKVVVKNQSLLLVTNAKENMRNSFGILGLSFQGISQNPNPTILSTMLADRIISSRMFSLYLSNKATVPSKIVFGTVNSKYLLNPQSQFIYAGIQGNRSYQIKIKGLMIGKLLLKINLALIDSGTTCLCIPAQILDDLQIFLEFSYKIYSIYNVESYAPQYSMLSIYLNQTQSSQILEYLPSIYLAIDDQHTLELKPIDYLNNCQIVNKISHQTECLTKLQRSKRDKQVILGVAFLQKYYTIFNQDDLQMGFARSINQGFFRINGVRFYA